MNAWDNGVHIRAIKKFDPDKPDVVCLIEMQVYPLPTDEALLVELTNAMRDAANAVLLKHKICSGEVMDFPAGGDMAAKQ